MGLKEFIEEDYIILSTKPVVEKIKSIVPSTRIVYPKDCIKIEDHKGINKFLIDEYLKGHQAVQELMTHDEYLIVFFRFSKTDMEILEIESDTRKEESNLFEIKVRNLDSVPEVYYKGEKIDAKELVQYRWETKSEKQPGFHVIEIKYLEKNEFSCKKITIKEEM